MSTGDAATRRIQLMLRKPWFALYARIKPTLVVDGRGHPAQWGLGTWQVPSDQPVVIGVYLFNRVWRFGQAESTLEPRDVGTLVYEAPALPFRRGRIRLQRDEHARAERQLTPDSTQLTGRNGLYT